MSGEDEDLLQIITTTAPLSGSQREDEEEASVSQEIQTEDTENQGMLMWTIGVRLSLVFTIILLCSTVALQYHSYFLSPLTGLSEYSVSGQLSLSHEILAVGPGPGSIPDADPVASSCDVIGDGTTSKYSQH